MFEQRSVRIAYDNGAVYRVDYLAGSRLRWTCLQGEDKGRSAEESYRAIEIASGVWFVHWMEADGIAVTQAFQPVPGLINTTIIIPGPIVGAEKPLALMLAGTVTAA